MAMKEALDGKVEVLTPDLPMHPKEALQFIQNLCNEVKPNLLVGNSCGSFLAQMLVPKVGVPALLGNPHFNMTRFLKERIGHHQYKSIRRDGKQDFEIDQQLINEFDELEHIQFDKCAEQYRDKVWGLFGEQDTLTHCEPIFMEHYSKVFHFPGGHTPTAEEVKTWYVPLIEKMLNTFDKA
ncbi:MAG: hypothetical protein LUD48_01365 [Prevotella sp.]|nr:hypothetical protein [Prevotella sp.]